MNKKLKETLKHLFATQEINNGWTSFSEKECKELSNYINDLEKRIEKAVEYIENNDLGVVKFYDRDVNGNLQHDIEKGYVKRQPLLDILNGRSDE